ncbi:MAG TPA: DUF1559 domain-containing protein, partial [Isosphaeraceae bacterium]|nr:DUF1559 domain-containing protein [Isosphaeraceae bacterium]
SIYDQRGMMWSTAMGAASFTSRYTPNQFNDYYRLENGADRLTSPEVCDNQPGDKLPCVAATGSNPRQRAFSGSKSRHPGGVDVLLGDGSVRFVKETIAQQVWLALCSMSGGEVLSADAY